MKTGDNLFHDNTREVSSYGHVVDYPKRGIFEVVSIKDYGAFVSISNTKKQGLLHRSQISNHPIDKVEDVMEVGEKIFCKVISTEVSTSSTISSLS
ncbi:hypothetical protein AHF37_01356 [Paragonimus kellicotti]|nr:hypothetical protein AHF37_01356 [Paragonimus kellicotti]